MKKKIYNRSMNLFKITFLMALACVVVFNTSVAYGMQPSHQDMVSSEQLFRGAMHQGTQRTLILIVAAAERERQRLQQQDPQQRVMEVLSQALSDGVLPESRLADDLNFGTDSMNTLRLKYYKNKFDGKEQPFVFGALGLTLGAAGTWLAGRNFTITGGALGGASSVAFGCVIQNLVDDLYPGVDYFYGNNPVRISELNTNQKLSVCLAKGLTYAARENLLKKVRLGCFGLSVCSLAAPLFSQSSWRVPAVGGGILGALFFGAPNASSFEINLSSRDVMFHVISQLLPFKTPDGSLQEKAGRVREILLRNPHLTPSQAYNKLKEMLEVPEELPALESKSFPGLMLNVVDLGTEDCISCSESYADLKKAVKLNNCKHTLCPTCLYVWIYFAKKITCPTCRAEIDLEQFSKEELKSQIDQKKYREIIEPPVVIQNPE